MHDDLEVFRGFYNPNNRGLDVHIFAADGDQQMRRFLSLTFVFLVVQSFPIYIRGMERDYSKKMYIPFFNFME